MNNTGELSILNVAKGDTKLSFDPADPAERERACRIVTDMLKRGYAIMVEVDGKTRRAVGFDPNTAEYLIRGLSKEEEREIKAKLAGKPYKKKDLLQRVPADKAPAVAVARAARGCAREAW
jgi:hypothetical protein